MNIEAKKPWKFSRRMQEKKLPNVINEEVEKSAWTIFICVSLCIFIIAFRLIVK